MEKVDDSRNNHNTCPECGGMVISVQDQGDIVCRECGLVIGERSVDTSHGGKRAFTQHEKNKRERTGSPITTLTPDISFSTVIDKRSIKNPDLKRASKWDTRTSWKKRNLLIAGTGLKRISGNLNMPDHVKKMAFNIYKRACKEKLLRGRSIHSMIAASLYYSCRVARVPITLQDILAESSEKPRDVRKSFYTLVRELKLKLPTRNPTSFVPKYANELNMPPEAEGLVNKALSTFSEHYTMSGKDPKGYVAGAIYLINEMKGLDITQKDIAETVGVTEVTLRSRYKELKKKLGVAG